MRVNSSRVEQGLKQGLTISLLTKTCSSHLSLRSRPSQLGKKFVRPQLSYSWQDVGEKKRESADDRGRSGAEKLERAEESKSRGGHRKARKGQRGERGGEREGEREGERSMQRRY